MKKVTYNGDEIVEIDDGEFVHVLRTGGSVVISNEKATEYEGQDDFTVRDTSKKKGEVSPLG